MQLQCSAATLYKGKSAIFEQMARHILQARRRRDVLKTCLISCIHQRRQTLLKFSALLMLLLTSSQSTNTYRLCPCFIIRNIGWRDVVWCSYSEARFRKTFRVSRGTFMYILSFIRNDPDLKILN